MIFRPQNLIKKDGAFIFSKNVSATACPAMNKEVIKEFWYNYSCHSSTLEIKESDEFAFILGEAELLSLDGSDYAINVEKSGIAISAKDSKSLIHGYMTLLDLLDVIDDRGEDEVKVDCCEIRETAQIGNRMVHFCVFPETELWELRKFLRFSAALKFTHVIVEFWGTLKLDCMKELAWRDAFEKEDVRPIIAEARDLGLEIVPMINHWGHAAFSRGMYGKHVVLNQNLSLATYFSKNGWCWAIEKEKVRKLLRAAREELIELCGEGGYFHIGCDEADGFRYTEEEMNFICDFINETSEELKKQGRRAIAWGDMFIYKHESYNKDNRYIWKAPSLEKESYMLSHLSKDVIIADWQYDAINPPIETSVTLKNAGFDVLLCPWDESDKVITACVDTVKNESLYGFIHTTWHTLSKGMWLIPLLAIGSYEDLAKRRERTPSYASYALCRVYDTNGDYEKAGWTKKQIDDITYNV